MSRKTAVAIAISTATLCAAGARADEAGVPAISFSGFGTLGVVRSGEKRADLTAHIIKPNGAGYSRTWSASVDSLLGAQMTAHLTPRLSAVVQVIAEQNYDDSYRPHLEWANVRYELTPELAIRAGRIVLPGFLVSETRKVAYTYPWVRPPPAVYGLVPITNSDGADVSYRLRLGSVAHTIEVTVGDNELKLANDIGTAKAKGSRGITYTTEYGPLTMRATYKRSSVTISAVAALFDSFRQFGQSGNALADKYGSVDKPFIVRGIGATYDPGAWFVTGEWGRVETNSFLGDRSGWYGSGGYRSGKFTTFVTFARARADNLDEPGLDVSALPPSLAAPATGLNASLNSILRNKPVHDTWSVGGRWDFMKNASATLQFDHIRIGPGSTGPLTNIQPDFQTGGQANVFGAAIAFVL
ncbi:MAG: hypothetical protein IPO58_12330 [Betaproteobacteria bacterium]|nr:hypothetical protein [Betaproteobacteria bacterium]